MYIIYIDVYYIYIIYMYIYIYITKKEKTTKDHCPSQNT